MTVEEGLIEGKVLYFSKAGKQNTNILLDYCKQVQEERSLNHVVVATTTGETGVKAAKVFAETSCNLVVVTHQSGFRKPGENEMKPEYLEMLKNYGNVKTFTGTHAFAGIPRGFRNELGTWQAVEIMALMLRRNFGQGTKVCMEICLMGADSGLLPVDRDVLSIAGTGSGADTAWIVRPTHTHNLFDLKMREPVARPLDF
ncbi:MAG: hypothetical protein ACFFD4_03060 [Candidatus Odinarchaeota archaeon]